MKGKSVFAMLCAAALALLWSCGGALDEDWGGGGTGTGNGNGNGNGNGSTDSGVGGTGLGGDGVAAYVLWRNGVAWPSKGGDSPVPQLFSTGDKELVPVDPYIQVWPDGHGVDFNSSARGHWGTKSIELHNGSATEGWCDAVFFSEGPASNKVSKVKFWAYAESAGSTITSSIGPDVDHLGQGGKGEGLPVPQGVWTDMEYAVDYAADCYLNVILFGPGGTGKIYIDDIRFIIQ
jgi:hypothetical protein